MSPILDKKTSVDLVKLLVFVVVTSLATAVLVVTIGNLSFGDSRDYKAEFTDATGVNKGDDIRVAGVRVGTVDKVEIIDRTRALISFTVDEGTSVNGGTNATIRYRNLVGQRYISLTQEVGDTQRLPAGTTIPVSRTRPALDLTVLFNGFKPLFQALSPEDVNQLSYELIQVFQGEGGTLEGLLAHTASVTSTLADRDEVIGDLIDNLSLVLDHVADRDEQLTRLIQSFRTLVGGLKKDRNAILGSLEDVSALSVRDRLPRRRHPRAVRQGHQGAAGRGRQHRQEQGRARPGPAGPADQARQDRPHRDLRLVLQLLPLRVPGPGQPARRRLAAGQVQHRLRQV